MSLHLNLDGQREKIKGHAIFVDSDYLKLMFEDEDVFTETTLFLKELKCDVIVEPLIKLEFLRNCFEPEQRAARNEFLAGEYFIPLPTRQEWLLRQREIVMQLSLIYASQKKGQNASLVDLFLAAQLEREPSGFILTGNRKDFPKIIFDVVSILNYEDNDGVIRAFLLLEFNKPNYKIMCDRLIDIERKAKEKLIEKGLI